MNNGVAISNAYSLYRVLRSGRLAIPYTRLVIELLREWGEGRGAVNEEWGSISNTDYHCRVLRSGRLAKPGWL